MTDEKNPDSDRGTPAGALERWMQVPRDIERAIAGLAEADLDLRSGEEMSIRETVHHLVEANLVASGIMIAALGRSGCTFDWSWLIPDGEWTRRMGYARVGVGPAIETLDALSRHLGGVIRATADGSRREVMLIDAPGDKPYARSVEQLLQMEVDHAREHLGEVARIRGLHGR